MRSLITTAACGLSPERKVFIGVSGIWLSWCGMSSVSDSEVKFASAGFDKFVAVSTGVVDVESDRLMNELTSVGGNVASTPLAPLTSTKLLESVLDRSASFL